MLQHLVGDAVRYAYGVKCTEEKRRARIAGVKRWWVFTVKRYKRLARCETLAKHNETKSVDKSVAKVGRSKVQNPPPPPSHTL
jgi:hypothetical protein